MTDRPSILIINGPNLNMLGQREPAIYGRDTLADIEAASRTKAAELGLDVDFLQSNAEGELVDWAQNASKSHAGIIINAGGYTHTSVALLDALTVSELPVVEVHLSNIFRREEFRHHSYISRAASGVICGFGLKGYLLALDAMAQLIRPD
ncbi:MAG: aroQ [Rhodospirillales bacterium]|nr:aroQ [Rhodospirillales bacterium]